MITKIGDLCITAARKFYNATSDAAVVIYIVFGENIVEHLFARRYFYNNHNDVKESRPFFLPGNKRYALSSDRYVDQGRARGFNITPEEGHLYVLPIQDHLYICSVISSEYSNSWSRSRNYLWRVIKEIPFTMSYDNMTYTATINDREYSFNLPVLEVFEEKDRLGMVAHEFQKIVDKDDFMDTMIESAKVRFATLRPLL